MPTVCQALTTSCRLTHWILTSTLGARYWLCPFCRWGPWGPEMMHNVLKITQRQSPSFPAWLWSPFHDYPQPSPVLQSHEPFFCIETLQPPSYSPAFAPAVPVAWHAVIPSSLHLHPSRLSPQTFSLWEFKTLPTKLVPPTSVMILNIVHTCPVMGHSLLYCIVEHFFFING